MTDAAITYDTPASTGTADRPALRILAAEPDAPVEHDETDEAHIWRSAAIGGLVGWTLTTAGIAVAGTLGGLGAANSVGLGAFAGAWTGVGFGFMMGASSSLARQERADHS